MDLCSRNMDTNKTTDDTLQVIDVTRQLTLLMIEMETVEINKLPVLIFTANCLLFTAH